MTGGKERGKKVCLVSQQLTLRAEQGWAFARHSGTFGCLTNCLRSDLKYLVTLDDCQRTPVDNETHFTSVF